LSEAKDYYWRSPAGIKRRKEMFGEQFTFQFVNNALQAYGRKNEVAGFEWVGTLDERTCNICDGQIGRQYTIGQFLPQLPAHVGCRCEWRVIKK